MLPRSIYRCDQYVFCLPDNFLYPRPSLVLVKTCAKLQWNFDALFFSLISIRFPLSVSIMAKSCKEIAESLVDCIKKSPCVRNGGSIKGCLNSMKNTDDDNECQALRNAYFSCKRGGLDMRTRIRGQKSYWSRSMIQKSAVIVLVFAHIFVLFSPQHACH
jgi:cytochrome c oxidase assembly factor 5